MSLSITTHGMMSVQTVDNANIYVNNGISWRAEWSSQPKGVLTIKNLTTGEEKRVSLSNAEFGTELVTSAEVETNEAHSYLISFSGKADRLLVGTVGSGMANPIQFDGNGHAEVSGQATVAL